MTDKLQSVSSSDTLKKGHANTLFTDEKFFTIEE